MTAPRSRPEPLTIILLGDPGAGKATQSERLVETYNLYDFDMGKELMALRQHDPEVDALLRKYQDKGKLTPTRIVRGIHHSMMNHIPAAQGILYDGHPKMLGEAQLVDRLLKKSGRRAPVVIYLSIPLEETVKRISARAGYFLGKYGKRNDDTQEALRNRARYYRKNVAQVIEFFKSRYPYRKISGLGAIAEVTQRFDEAIKEMTESI